MRKISDSITVILSWTEAEVLKRLLEKIDLSEEKYADVHAYASVMLDSDEGESALDTFVKHAVIVLG